MHEVKQIRNAVLIGHGNSGKTTLAEALLYTAGTIKRLGRVDDGTTSMDFEPEETKRHITISTAFSHLSWKKREVFLADTPGDDNFVNETRFAIQVADSAILTVGAAIGVRNQTEKFVTMIRERNLPCLICITKMDRERANFSKVVDDIRTTFDLNPVVLYLAHRRRGQLPGRGGYRRPQGLVLQERRQRTGRGGRDPRRTGRGGGDPARQSDGICGGDR